jgi:hypothetical protein
LPEDEQTSKHGGGGRYNTILSSRGANKRERERERERERDKERKKKEKKKE